MKTLKRHLVGVALAAALTLTSVMGGVAHGEVGDFAAPAGGSETAAASDVEYKYIPIRRSIDLK